MPFCEGVTLSCSHMLHVQITFVVQQLWKDEGVKRCKIIIKILFNVLIMKQLKRSEK